MKKVIGGKTYVEVPELEYRKCLGCVAVTNGGVAGPLCHALENECSVNHTIWKEQTMSEEKEKTALELVDELSRILELCSQSELDHRFTEIKSAIERERAKDAEEYSALMNVSADRAGIISDLTAQLKSAITMRPISELPDKVPDECDCVMVDSHGVTMCKTYATHFYILPLPKAERRLHPCYMPGCGKEVVTAQASIGGYFVSCSCGASGPVKDDEEAAKQAWGYAE